MIDKRYGSIIALAGVIIAIALYLNAQPQLLATFEKISLRAVLYLIALQLLFLATNGIFLREFAAKFGIRLRPKEWFGLAVVTTMGNYITPFSGGLIARATYLKHRHAFPYAQFVTLLASNYLVTFWAVGLAGVLASISLAETTQFSWQVTLWFGVVTIATSILALLPSVKVPGNNRLTRAVNSSLEGWVLVKQDRYLLIRLVVYTFFNILLNGLSFWVAYAAVDSPISFTAALLIGLLAVFSLLVNITPGNFGVQEAVVSLSSGLLGAGVGPGLLAALLIRTATLVWAFSLGPVFSLLLTRELTMHRLAGTLPVPDIEQSGK